MSLKKDKILFWIDSALDQFVTEKYFSESYDCEKFAIIDINDNSKEFFQTQKFIQFEKTWFIRDYISKPQNDIDVEYLTKFEKNYDIKIWNIAFSERAFYGFNPYYKFNSHEILSIFEQNCKFFESILDKIKPDFLFLRMTDDHQTELLHQICKSKGIKILTLHASRFGFRGMISETTDFFDFPFSEIKNYNVQYTKSFDELREFMQKYSNQVMQFSKDRKFSTKKRIFSGIYFFTTFYNSQYRNYFKNFGRTPMKILINEGILSYKKIKRERFLKKYSLSKIGDTKFIYFPLHFEPERSISIAAPFYTNQLEVITNIAKSLPVNFLLFVKDHPVQSVTGWKSISYYKKILDLPNVRLIHPSVSGNELLKKASLIITIAGTAALEASFYGKPSIVFADTLFSQLSSVKRLTSYEQLPDSIQNSLKTKVDLDELNAFVNMIDKNSFTFDETGMMILFGKNLFNGAIFTDSKSLSKMGDFLEKYRAIFEPISLEYIKKIKQIKQIDEPD